MQLIQHIYNNSEKDWLGVFHASAISNGAKSVLYLGDSGNGKSTSLALLQANGFSCLADDFVPILAKNQHVYTFPAAISIKQNSLKTVMPLYPELKNAEEFYFKNLNKTVRYLKPKQNSYLHLPCTALIYIKYKANSPLLLEPITAIEAFQKLVPDSWISPLEDHVNSFLNWFSKMKYYQLHYSDTKDLVSATTQLFNNDL